MDDAEAEPVAEAAALAELAALDGDALDDDELDDDEHPAAASATQIIAAAAWAARARGTAAITRPAALPSAECLSSENMHSPLAAADAPSWT